MRTAKKNTFFEVLLKIKVQKGLFYVENFFYVFFLFFLCPTTKSAFVNGATMLQKVAQHPSENAIKQGAADSKP